jgi:outer membrane protein
MGVANGTCVQGAEGRTPSAAEKASSDASMGIGLTAAEVFKLADEARARGDLATAERAYRALVRDRDGDIRSEARFRLGLMLADTQRRYAEAALEFRRILDEKPDAARVRVELARMHAMLGNLGSAERELRTAEASGLPPEIERLVRFYAQALSARRPLGGSFEIALAPDSNINRATRSTMLGTVIGDFALDEDARAKSGVGIAMRGQGYLKKGIEPNTELLMRASGSAAIYRDANFNDVILGFQAGPQYASGRDRITVSAGPTWRWYGKDPYSVTLGGNATWQHPVGNRSQLRIEGGISHVTNKRNRLQTADDFSASVSFDRAFTARLGGGVQTFGFREAARDPGYSLTSGGTSVYAFREMGRTTLIGTLSYSHLKADARLFLYPRRRIENRYSASLAATLRALHLGSFAPLVRLKWERNRSSIEIYDYKRISAEFGVTSAF